MNIFLDSNIIIEDYNLKKGDTILFLNNFEDAGFQCFISKVTYLEVLSNYTKHLTDKTEKFNSALDSINRQTENDLSKLDKKFIEMETSKYKDKFDSKLRQYNITICPLPKIEHSEILRHSLDKKNHLIFLMLDIKIF